MTAAWHGVGMRRAIFVVAVVALGGWTPFRTIDPDVEAGNRAYAEGRYNDALAAYDRARRTRGACHGAVTMPPDNAGVAVC